MSAIHYQIVVQETEPGNAIGSDPNETGFVLLKQFGPVEAWEKFRVKTVGVFWHGIEGADIPTASDFELEVFLPGQGGESRHGDAYRMVGDWLLHIGSDRNSVKFRLYRREEGEARISESPP